MKFSNLEHSVYHKKITPSESIFKSNMVAKSHKQKYALLSAFSLLEKNQNYANLAEGYSCKKILLLYRRFN